ncbi:MAG: CPBP family intramembrane glutamic endopeptidase [Bacteroidota bacterium]
MTEEENLEEKIKKEQYPGIGTGFLLLLITLMLQGVGTFVMFIPGLSEGQGMFLAYTIGLSIAVWIAKKWVPNHSFQFNKINWILLIPILIGTTSASILIEPVVTLIPASDFMYELMEKMVGYGIYSFLMVAIAAPVLEELLFRGVILEGFLKRYRPWKAIFWSAFMFGIIHLNPWQFIPAFAIGIIMGWIYYETRSLIPVILIHFANNSLSYWASVTFGLEAQTLGDIVGSQAYVLIYILAVILSVVTYLFLEKAFRKEVNRPDIPQA